MSAASSLARGFIISIMYPFITFIAATEPNDVGTSTAERGLTALVDKYTDAVRRSVGVAPSSAVNGRCGIRLAPGDRRYAGAGVGLYDPRSAYGRPLTVDTSCEKSRVGAR
jgi:hypothetical protein